MKNTILIIDDDATNIMALSAVLRSRNWNAVSANHVKKGWQLLEKDDTIGMVLLDMMMPDIDGYEMLHTIRQHEQFRNIPVIAVTAQVMKGDREKCLAAGASDYVSKPIDVDRLMQLLRHYLN